ncbi:MAG: glycosyltransferase [Alphaproteobacteria bacterium]
MSTLVHFVEHCVAGIDTYVRSLLRAQINDPAFDRIVILTGADDTAPFADEPDLLTDKVEVRHYPFSRSLLAQPKALLHVRRALKEIDGDVIFMHCSFPGLLGRVAKMLGGVRGRVIYNAHSWSFEQDRGGLTDWVYVQIEKFLAGQTDLVINCSHASMFLAEDRGVHFRDMRVIQNGVKDTASPPTTPAGPTEGPLKLGFIGRFDRQKGLDELLQGFSACTRDDIALTLVGWSHLQDSSAANPALDDPRITVAGKIPPLEIDAAYRGFDALVMPSRYEGLPLVALEAMRNACPLLLSDRTSLPYLVVPGFNGDVFSFNHPHTLTALLNGLDRPSLKKMGMNARTVYEATYREDMMVAETNRLIKEQAGMVAK